jgi:hypothetical protein
MLAAENNIADDKLDQIKFTLGVSDQAAGHATEQTNAASGNCTSIDHP